MRCQSVDEREGLSGGEHEIVRDGRMPVGEIVCGQAALVGEAVQVGHGRASDDVGVIVIFLDDNEDVAEAHPLLAGRRRSLRNLSYATVQGNDAEAKREQATCDSGQSERADPMTSNRKQGDPHGLQCRADLADLARCVKQLAS